ncbi:MAG: hypothetical protein P4L40_14570 [Terracidiphilus sp.]|nr:hypothetical protein [Terracidiphilus sp.]
MAACTRLLMFADILLLAAADAGRMFVVDAVIGLCDDIPGGAPPECETYRDTMKNLHETMPARLVCVCARERVFMWVWVRVSCRVCVTIMICARLCVLGLSNSWVWLRCIT